MHVLVYITTILKSRMTAYLYILFLELNLIYIYLYSHLLLFSPEAFCDFPRRATKTNSTQRYIYSLEQKSKSYVTSTTINRFHDEREREERKASIVHTVQIKINLFSSGRRCIFCRCMCFVQCSLKAPSLKALSGKREKYGAVPLNF
jgi:hypothetical protein